MVISNYTKLRKLQRELSEEFDEQKVLEYIELKNNKVKTSKTKTSKHKNLPELTKQIADRDCWTCQMCRKFISNDRELQIHHIDYNKENNKPLNLITLCWSCHGKTNTNRKYWINKFIDILIEKELDS